MLSTYKTLNDKRILPPQITPHLGSRDSLILVARSTPSSTPISTILYSLVLIHNFQRAQASNAQIYQLDDSIELEVSTLAYLSRQFDHDLWLVI